MSRTVTGPLAWTLPTSIVLACLATWGWLMFALISRGAPPACELLGRSAWLATTAAATAAFLFPFTWIERRWLRGAVAFVAAGVAGGAAWWLTAMLFPQFC